MFNSFSVLKIILIYFLLSALRIATPKSWPDAGFCPVITKKNKETENKKTNE
jgi:hypothetical protein